jgi:hypothetical protein
MTDTQAILAFEMRRQGANSNAIAFAIGDHNETVHCFFRDRHKSNPYRKTMVFRVPDGWTQANIVAAATRLLEGA